MSDVTIEVEESPQVETAPVIVVPAPSDPNAMPEWALDHERRIAALEQNVTVVAGVVETVAETAESAAVAADIALSAADTAIDVAVSAAETADEVAEIAVATADETGVLPEVMMETDTSIIPDVTPKQTHPLFRTLEEWRHRIGNS